MTTMLGLTWPVPPADFSKPWKVAAALFPRHFGPAGLTEEAVDSFIAHTLDDALHSLREQIRRELRLAPYLPGKDTEQLDAKAREITRAFAEKCATPRPPPVPASPQNVFVASV